MYKRQVTDFITVNKGNIIYLDQYVDHVENIFFMRIEWELKDFLVPQEKIDPVRFIGNYSSGKMGFALAEECARRGAQVTLITGPCLLYTSRCV